MALPAPILTAADAAPPAQHAEAKPSGPWTDTFTMSLRDEERTYVVHEGQSYLLCTLADFKDRDFLDGKDVALLSKFQHAQDDHLLLYRPADLDVVATPELWSDKVDGDNFYLFGHLMVDEDGKQHLKVRAIATAPSDSELIKDRLRDIADDDWDKRLAVAAWVRDQGNKQGNQDWWMQKADALLTKVIQDLAAKAQAGSDYSLLKVGMDYAVNLLKDPITAARLASAPWVDGLKQDDRDDLTVRMHRIGMAFYQKAWRPRPEALALEFEDRLAAIPWKDADGFYKLGRWADANAEVLPQAKDRAYRAYTAGLKANPDHAGIRRELGMDLTAADGGAQAQANEGRVEYKDPTTGIVVHAPQKWKRGEIGLEGVRFEDPGSETATITVRFFAPTNASPDALWPTMSAHMRALAEFTSLSETTSAGALTVHRLVFSYTETHLKRMAAMEFAFDNATKCSVILEAGFVDEEQERTVKAMDDMIDHLLFPKP